jgi:hypothetical protein
MSLSGAVGDSEANTLLLTVEKQQRRTATLTFDGNNTMSFADLEQVDVTDARDKKRAEAHYLVGRLAAKSRIVHYGTNITTTSPSPSPSPSPSHHHHHSHHNHHNHHCRHHDHHNHHYRHHYFHH